MLLYTCIGHTLTSLLCAWCTPIKADILFNNIISSVISTEHAWSEQAPKDGPRTHADPAIYETLCEWSESP